MHFLPWSAPPPTYLTFTFFCNDESFEMMAGVGGRSFAGAPGAVIPSKKVALYKL